MANEPTLSEITNITVDPERGTGQPATLFPDKSKLVDQLHQSAQFKAQNDWNKYTTFLGNLKDIYKDIGDISKEPVLTQDRPELIQRQAEIFKKIADDPKAFLGGGKSFFDIQGDLAKLRTDATESKANKIAYDAHKLMLEQTPSMASKKNLQILNDYTDNQKLGSRKLPALEMPTIIDYTKLFNDTIKGATQDQSASEVVDALGNPTQDGEYIETTAGKLIKKDRFLNNWDALLDVEHDEYGHPLKDQQQEQYDELIKKNPELKKQWATLKDYWHWQGEQKFGATSDIESDKKTTLAANPNYKVGEQLKIEKEKLGIEWAKLGIENKKANAQIDRWNALTKGSSDTKAGALNFATTLVGKLKDLGISASGGTETVITPDKLRQLSSEDLKYLGSFVDTETTDELGKKVVTKGLTSLTLNSSDVLVVHGGKISVLSNASYDNKSGKWVGRLDPTRTTTITNIATNKVNEENQLSSGKEVNDYLPVDMFGSDKPAAVVDQTPATLQVKGSSGRTYTLPQ